MYSVKTFVRHKMSLISNSISHHQYDHLTTHTVHCEVSPRMLVYSADATLPEAHTSSTCSQYLSVSDPIALVFNKSEETHENTRETVKETPSSTASTITMSNQDSRCQLQCQLHLEMQKKRPDHFVIGVTCRSLGGVPSELRAQVWKELLGVAQSEQLSLDQYILQVEEDLENQRVITVDATRTRSTEPRFKQPETIELVIKLLTYYCKCHKIQYKQGMNEVLAPFLLLTEEREGCDGHVPLSDGVVYQCFDALIDKFLPHVFQDKEFRSLQCSFQLYRLLMLYHDPTLCHYLDQHHMTPELYVTPWFITLFARSLRPEFVFYLWDFFLLEEDPYLLHFVAYALVAANRKQIFRAEIALLPQVLSSLTFSSRHELERVCVNALAISESTPRSFKRDLYSVCYGGFTDAMVPLLDQLNASSSLQVYPDELIRNLLDRLTTKSKRKRSSVSSLPAPVNLEEPTDSNKPLYSPESDQTTLEDESESDDGADEVTALKFLVLDCRPVEEYHKSHLSLSHHIDPNITERPEELETLMKGFLQMKGCHFCFVGPSLETPPLLSRSTSNNAALNTIARLASVISSDKSQHLATQDTSPRPMKFADGEVVVGDVLPSGRPATLTRTMSRGEPGSLATEISSNGASKVHEEHVLVTRLVLTFLQKGFKYVSRLDGGFLELEKSIQSMDTFSQEQLLISSPDPPPVCQDQGFANAVASSSGGFNLFAKMGLGRSNVVFQDDEATRHTLGKGFDGSRYRFTRTATFPSPEMTSSRVMKDAQQEKKRTSRLKSTSSAAVSTLSQRLMHLRAAAKDVALSASSMAGLDTHAPVEPNTSEEEGWVKVYDQESKVGGSIVDVEIQAGLMGISFRKAGTSSTYFAAVDSLVPASQAVATGLIKTGDVLVAINGASVANKKFLSVIKLIMGSPRPVTLRFLTPRCSEKDVEMMTRTLPLAPRLVSATRHSICITWPKLSSSSSSSSAFVSYQLQFSKQCGDEFHVWLPVAMKEEGTKTGVDLSGVTRQTNGTMVGLEPGESVVFRVRCGIDQHWGPYSPSSRTMSTLTGQTVDEPTSAASSTVNSAPMSLEDLGAAMFLPGVCPDYIERGHFLYRVVLDFKALRRPTFESEGLEMRLTKGQLVKGSHRLVCPGAKQVFVRLCMDDMEEEMKDRDTKDEIELFQRDVDDAMDSLWAFETNCQGELVLEVLGEGESESAKVNEQPKPMVHLFLGSHDASASSGVNNVAFMSSMSSTSASSTSTTVSLSPPRIVQVFPVSSSEMVVTWDPVHDVGVTKYQLQYMKDRLAAMWWTVKPDLDATTVKYAITGLLANTPYRFRLRCGTEDNKWSPYSEASESCRTLPGGIVSIDGEEMDGVRLSASQDKTAVSPAPFQGRTGNTILNKAVAAAARLKRRPESVSHALFEPLTTATDDRSSELTLPASRHVNVAEWKSSSSEVYKDFRFYHVTKFEEQEDQCQAALSRLGHREMVVTPLLLIVLNVMTATREGYALVEEWRPLSSIVKVEEREDMDDSLVFHFTTPSGNESNRLIVVVEGSKACAKLVQKYQAEAVDAHV